MRMLLAGVVLLSAAGAAEAQMQYGVLNYDPYAGSVMQPQSNFFVPSSYPYGWQGYGYNAYRPIGGFYSYGPPELRTYQGFGAYGGYRATQFGPPQVRNYRVYRRW